MNRIYNAGAVADTSELRALALRLGNPLAPAGKASSADVVVTRSVDRATADDRESPRASLEKKLEAAKAAARQQSEP